jgi:hypothetical protein
MLPACNEGDGRKPSNDEPPPSPGTFPTDHDDARLRHVHERER